MAASIATVARAAPIDSIAASIARPSRVPRARRAAATLGGVLVAPRRDRAPGVRTRAAAGPPASAPSPALRVLRPRLLSPTSRRALRGVPRAASEETPSEGVTAADTRRVLVVVALAMLLASADRTIFSLASLAIADDLNLTMSAVGLLQSAFFWGYGLTQIIGGVAADAVGGARVLLIGLGLWSVAVALIPASALSPNPIITLIIARALFGAASGRAVPASAAAVAASVPGDRRGGALSFVFGAFNCGSAFGLLLAGGLIAATGWQSVFLAFGGVGLMWSVIGYAALPEAAKRPREPTGAGGRRRQSRRPREVRWRRRPRRRRPRRGRGPRRIRRQRLRCLRRAGSICRDGCTRSSPRWRGVTCASTGVSSSSSPGSPCTSPPSWDSASEARASPRRCPGFSPPHLASAAVRLPIG